MNPGIIAVNVVVADRRKTTHGDAQQLSQRGATSPQRGAFLTVAQVITPPESHSRRGETPQNSPRPQILTATNVVVGFLGGGK